nr:hypothetical protein [Tanacetum cinerariifolium]
GLFEVGESSSARDSSNVDGLAPWALRRDFEASRARARVMEAELVRIGAVPKPSSGDEDTERPRKKSKNSTSDGTEGQSELRGPASDS